MHIGTIPGRPIQPPSTGCPINRLHPIAIKPGTRPYRRLRIRSPIVAMALEAVAIATSPPYRPGDVCYVTCKTGGNHWPPRGYFHASPFECYFSPLGCLAGSCYMHVHPAVIMSPPCMTRAMAVVTLAAVAPACAMLMQVVAKQLYELECIEGAKPFTNCFCLHVASCRDDPLS